MKTLLSVFSIIIILTTISCKEKKRETHDFKLRPFPKYYKTFNNMNEEHLLAAEAIGIKPISSRKDAENNKEKLVEIKDNDYYVIDDLKHSLPFLVKPAALQLDSIGIIFQDSLISLGAPLYKLIITSVLRTQEDIKGLRKRNGNSQTNSAHLYGTTFDIAYTRFIPVDTSDISIAEEKLKVVLAEVLRDLKNNKKCYVKYEVKQGCFHVTARPQNLSPNIINSAKEE